MQNYPYPKEYWVVGTHEGDRYAQRMVPCPGMFGLDPVYHRYAATGSTFLSKETCEAFIGKVGWHLGRAL